MWKLLLQKYWQWGRSNEAYPCPKFFILCLLRVRPASLFVLPHVTPSPKNTCKSTQGVWPASLFFCPSSPRSSRRGMCRSYVDESFCLTSLLSPRIPARQRLGHVSLLPLISFPARNRSFRACTRQRLVRQQPPRRRAKKTLSVRLFFLLQCQVRNISPCSGIIVALACLNTA
jgi:hypothetical protein